MELSKQYFGSGMNVRIISPKTETQTDN